MGSNPAGEAIMFGAVKTAMKFITEQRIAGITQPQRDNSLGVVYIKDGKIFVAYFDGNKINDKEIDVEIKSLSDFKKLLTKQLLKDKLGD